MWPWARRVRSRFFDERCPDLREVDVGRSIVSFTFDDAPVSAGEVGGRILSERGLLGTFYMAMGLSRSPSQGEHPIMSPGDVASLHGAGHDIQCHTYSHISLRGTSSGTISADCARNRADLESLLPEHRVQHFAYPFGRVSPWAKRSLGPSYLSMRSAWAGVNRGAVDIRRLKAVSICEVDLDMDEVRAFIDSLRDDPGWLIFFTHEVCDEPSQWGTRSGTFESIVDYALERGERVLPVRQAFDSAVSDPSPR
jgi:peptidoglycan/xylan/chitin deacetylase (PgdA/CDA1 family)